MELSDRHILLGVTGGVAAYKAAELSRALQSAGATVQVAMSEAATRFVGPATFQALTGRSVHVDAWDTRIENGMPHIELSRRADLVLIAPATADFIAKLAHGLADDLLSTLCLARECPLMLAPAMNRQMWENPATQRNVQLLKQDGIVLVGPVAGEQACGETGLGRMVEAVDIVEAAIAHFTPRLLDGVRTLVTAGPTYEPIDPVRGITNLSSGKMGYTIALAAARAGAQVTLVSGPTALAAPAGVSRVDVRTASQMHDAVMARIGEADLFISVAAVADWRPAAPSSSKIKKVPGEAPPSLSFALNPDILATVARRPNPPYCVGFAAESEALEANGQRKRIAKGVPLLCANIGPETFGRDDNELLLIDEQGTHRLPRASKSDLAAALVGEIAQRIASRPR